MAVERIGTLGLVLVLAGCPSVHAPTDGGADVALDAGPPDPTSPQNCRAALVVPGGRYWRGNGRIDGGFPWSPGHQVILTRDLWVGRYEVTVACHAACVADGSCRPDPNTTGYLLRGRPRGAAVLLTTAEEGDDLCAWMGGRLLTDAEFVAAARGPEGRVWPWLPPPADPGNSSIDPAADLCERCGAGVGPACFDEPPSLVGAHPGCRTPFGHDDLLAGVPEMLLDFNAGYVAQLPRDGDWIDPFIRPEPPRYTDRGQGWMFTGQAYVGAPGARCAWTSPPEPLFVAP